MSQPPREQHQPGFLASLFDVEFNYHITGRVVSVLYVLVLIVAVLEAVVFLVAGVGTISAAFNWLGVLAGLLWLLGAVLLPVFTVILYRLLLEFFVVQHRIWDELRRLRGSQDAGGGV